MCNPHDLVLIPFPYADLGSSKKRPVLVLTNPDRHGDFIALAVTIWGRIWGRICTLPYHTR